MIWGKTSNKRQLHPRMSRSELNLFLSFVGKSERYLEFGAGGSTFVASSHVKDWIISIDSSKAWLETVESACSSNGTKPELHFVDVGPTGDWGVPIDPATKARWADYHTAIWSIPKSASADLYFVDGRFRVACFAQIVIRCCPDAIIGFHDFSSRADYHRVREIAREIASAEDISFFQPLTKKKEEAVAILESFKLQYA
jgi:hypothetical protein